MNVISDNKISFEKLKHIHIQAYIAAMIIRVAQPHPTPIESLVLPNFLQLHEITKEIVEWYSCQVERYSKRTDILPRNLQ